MKQALPNTVRILNPSIDDYNDTVVIRGVVDINSLEALKVDVYQRELLPSVSRKHIQEALKSDARLPDITLGMRGDNFTMENSDLLLLDPTYIIDGQQRVQSVLEMLPCDYKIRLGSVIHINTDATWERKLFQKLNQYQQKVSPNILLRNAREDHALINTLYSLTMLDKQFVMHDRVCWQQHSKRGELLTATTMLSIILHLHSHLGPHGGAGITYLVPASDKAVSIMGLPVLRANIKTFFDTVDSCWGIKRIHYKGGAPYMRQTFLQVLAKVFSDHLEFWKGDKKQRLEVGYLIKRKLSSFPINDPEIIRLAGATGASRLTLYSHMVNHLNSGKRVNHLVSRNSNYEVFNTAEQEEEEVA